MERVESRGREGWRGEERRKRSRVGAWETRGREWGEREGED